MNKGFWKHTDSKDVFIEVLETHLMNDNKTEARIRWWNFGFTGKPWIIHKKLDTIIINNSDLKNWLPTDGIRICETI